MSTLQSRSSIALLVLVLGLTSSRLSVAQSGINAGPVEAPGNFFRETNIGVTYDRLNQAKAERSLRYHEEKLRRDSQRCNTAAAEHDARKIQNLKFRILADEWLIRKNSTQELIPYPFLADPISYAAIAQATCLVPYNGNPQLVPPAPPRPTAPVITITITCVESAGSTVAFEVDGTSYQAAPGSRQDLTVPLDATVRYDAGGSLGKRQYTIQAGNYEFRSTPEGIAFYRLPAAP